MAVSNQYLDYLLGQLKGLGGVDARRMFGGLGLYSRGTFFGLLYKERLYFKTDDTTRPEYEARGCEGFNPRADLKSAKMTYYTVPAEVLEDEDEVVQWARKAVTAALTKEVAQVAAANLAAAAKMAATKAAAPERAVTKVAPAKVTAAKVTAAKVTAAKRAVTKRSASGTRRPRAKRSGRVTKRPRAK
jgi:DNA transformation protein